MRTFLVMLMFVVYKKNGLEIEGGTHVFIDDIPYSACMKWSGGKMWSGHPQ